MENLVEKAKKGDKKSFSKLIASIQLELYNIARIKLNDEDDINDVLQDTVLDIYKGLKKLKDNRLFKTWSVKILLNNCNNILKKKYRKKNIISLDDYIEKYDEHSDISVDNISSKLSYEKALSILSEQEKTIFALYYQEEYKIKEISEILEINDNTVKSILKRGRDKLKKYYKKEENYE